MWEARGRRRQSGARRKMLAVADTYMKNAREAEAAPIMQAVIAARASPLWDGRGLPPRARLHISVRRQRASCASPDWRRRREPPHRCRAGDHWPPRPGEGSSLHSSPFAVAPLPAAVRWARARDSAGIRLRRR